MTEAIRNAIIAEAETWLLTPYISGARVKGVGVDCGQLLHVFYSPYIPLPPMPAHYAEDWTLHRGDEKFLEWLIGSGCFTEVPRPTLAGLAVFQYGRCFGHGALYVGKGMYIHAYGRSGHGVVRKSNRHFFVHDKGPDKGKPRSTRYFDPRLS